MEPKQQPKPEQIWKEGKGERTLLLYICTTTKSLKQQFLFFFSLSLSLYKNLKKEKKKKKKNQSYVLKVSVRLRVEPTSGVFRQNKRMEIGASRSPPRPLPVPVVFLS